MSVTLRPWIVLATVGLSCAWLYWGAPWLEAQLLSGREQGPRTLSEREIHAAWQDLESWRPELLPVGLLAAECQRDMTRLRELTSLEDDSLSVIWVVLTQPQREQGRELADTLPPLEYEGDSRFVEPETPALSLALLEGYGYQLAEYPAPPQLKPWVLEGWDRRGLMMATIALVKARLIDEAQAAQLLALTIEVLQLQQAKKSLELQLMKRLPLELQEVATQRWLMRHGPSLGHPQGHFPSDVGFASALRAMF